MKNVEVPASKSLVSQTLKTVSVSMIFTAIAMLILAIFVTYSTMSEKTVSVCVTAATFICVFASGFAASSAIGKNGWLAGLVAGVIYVVVMLVLGWITLGDFSLSNETTKMFIISIVSGVIGGITGVNFKRKRKIKR